MDPASNDQRKLCHCRKHCGGPGGPGVMLTYRTFRNHQKTELDNLVHAQSNRSSNSQQIPDGQEAGSSNQDSQQGRFKRPRLLSQPEDDHYHDLAESGGGSNMAQSVAGENDIAHEEGIADRSEVGLDIPRNNDIERFDEGSQNQLGYEEEVEQRMPVPERPNPTAEDEQSEDPVPNFVPIIDDLKTTMEFIEALKSASLDDEVDLLGEELLDRIRNPPEEILTIEDPNARLSLDIFLAVTNASEDTYNQVCKALKRRFPNEELLSYHKVKRLVEDLTGVTLFTHDMCIASCIGFTGPFSDLQSCPMCGEPRYEPSRGPTAKKVPRKQFQTIPLAPQLQALWRTPEGARNLRYRERYTEKILKDIRENQAKTLPYSDFFDGSDYLNLYLNQQLKSGDMVLLMSMDGAQLYRNKVSECWMYIWIILDHSPDVRYKKRHVLPGGFIPGPNKPKNVDSFIFPGLHHLSAIQREGLKIWDADKKFVFRSDPLFALGTADGPGMACLSGMVGHQGKVHCRLYCPLKGRHKSSAPQYYPARLKPNNYNVPGSSHPDVNLNNLLQSCTREQSTQRYKNNLDFVIRSTNPTEFKRRRLETGICKPSILLGLPEGRTLGIPHCFPLDIMHLPALNIPDLFIPLWRGTFECDKLTDDKSNWDWAVFKSINLWKAHGKTVANATPYLPGSFDRPPRNPAEKISSGYKAWEFLIYFYGLGPAVFFQILPEKYWRNYCKLVRGVRILMQTEIFEREIKEAHLRITEFSDEFEELYCQRRADRLHFVRPSIHTPSHWAPETQRVGPGIIYSQWAMERTIGNLGEEIKQHSDPYSNLAQRGLRRCQVNALKAMLPDLDYNMAPTLPRGAVDLGDNYTLLRAADYIAREVRACEKDAFIAYDNSFNVPQLKVVRWARLRLPNRQITRTLWKEGKKALESLRISRNVQFVDEKGVIQIGEILYFVLRSIDHDGDTQPEALAVTSLYGPPNQVLMEMSSGTYWSARHLRDSAIKVINVKSIRSVIAMVPDLQYKKWRQDGTENNRWFLVEKPGLRIAQWILQDDNEPGADEFDE